MRLSAVALERCADGALLPKPVLEIQAKMMSLLRLEQQASTAETAQMSRNEMKMALNCRLGRFVAESRLC